MINTIVGGDTNISSNTKFNTNTYANISCYIILNINDRLLMNNDNIGNNIISYVNIVCNNIHGHIINTMDIHTCMFSYIITRITNNNIMSIQYHVILLTIFLTILIL